MSDSLSIAVHIFERRILTSLSLEKILLPMYMNLSTNFRGLPFVKNFKKKISKKKLLASSTKKHKCNLELKMKKGNKRRNRTV